MRSTLQREEPAVLVHRHLAVDDIVAALRVGEEVLGAVARPFHRPAEALRRLQHQCVLPIDEYLRAEAAADIRRDDAKLCLLDLEHLPARIFCTECTPCEPVVSTKRSSSGFHSPMAERGSM